MKPTSMQVAGPLVALAVWGAAGAPARAAEGARVPGAEAPLPASLSHDPRVAIVRAFRALRAAELSERARSFLTDDPRIWYETIEGSGDPWTLDGGSWGAWDRHFGSASTELSWELAADTVRVLVEEINDFYRLTERGPGRTRLSYLVGGDLRIAGMLVQGQPRDPATLVRYEEFKAWAREHEPGELAALQPEGRIDPSRPERWRALLERWRSASGLPPVVGRGEVVPER